MPTQRNPLRPLDDRGPLRVMFLLTSMPVGGAEALLVNLVRRLDRSRILPELCCLKSLGPLGEKLAREIPAHSGLLQHKYDWQVWRRLSKLFRAGRVDAVVTIGAGDKMFWGRLAARTAGVPVVVSALHSTGWPDSIGRLNRMLTPWTDAFVGVAAAHGRHLVEVEGFPASKVRVIPNGVDVERFAEQNDAARVRGSLGITPRQPVAGIVAALRPEKNHAQFLQAATVVLRRLADARFLIVGDGPERAALEAMAASLGIADATMYLGSRCDIPELLSAMDVFVLTSRMEANPVSILEAMAAARPVVAPRVGSIAESVQDGVTGFLTAPLDVADTADRLGTLLSCPDFARSLGTAGRRWVARHASLDGMVRGYENLLCEIYSTKCSASGRSAPAPPTRPEAPLPLDPSRR